MKHLWAPWRMAYIDSEGTHEEGCIFCRKSQSHDDEENLVLYRSDSCFVIMNLFPYNNGHIMIAPYAHKPGITDLEIPVLADIMSTAQLCVRAIGEAIHPDGFNMGINQGTAAGAGIADHLHFHIVPRWNGDTNFMPVLADVKVMPDFLANTYRQIRAKLPS